MRWAAAAAALVLAPAAFGSAPALHVYKVARVVDSDTVSFDAVAHTVLGTDDRLTAAGRADEEVRSIG